MIRNIFNRCDFSSKSIKTSLKFLLFLLLIIFFFNRQSSGIDRKLLGVSTSTSIHPLKNFNQVTFYKNINKADSLEYLNNEVAGGIIPHDPSAGYMIALFFKNLVNQKPNTIILLGPNHKDTGGHGAITSNIGWETPFGILNTNKEVIHDLVNGGFIRIDNEIISAEQSITAIVSYIKYFLPVAEIVPIILKSNFDYHNADNLGLVLSNIINQEMVLVSSVDFSHYLKEAKARQKDQITIKLIRNYDTEKIFTLSSEYLDSPSSISTLLFAMERAGRNKISVIDYANSAQFHGNDPNSTTSYLLLTFN